MPKATFFNLSEKKRNAIIETSLQEFAKYDFRRASITRIVETLNIAKGSMYQYFHDKQDLYFYLLEMGSREKLTYIEAKTDASGGEEFFSLYSAILIAGVTYDFTHPAVALLLLNGMKESESRELGRISEKLTEGSRAFIKKYIDLGIDRGEIRKDLDKELIVLTTNQVTLGLKEFLEKKYNFSVRQHLGEMVTTLPFSRSSLEKDIFEVVELLRRGIASK